MKREKWLFEFKHGELLAASQEREKYHRQHADDWDGAAKALDEEMTKTARVEEQPITGGVNRVLRFDPGLQAEMNTAVVRRQYHSTKQELYARWVLALGRTPEASRQLNVDDVAFFFAEMSEGGSS